MKTLLSLMGIALGGLAAVALNLLFRHWQQPIPGGIVVVGWAFALLMAAFSVHIGWACLTVRNDPLFYMRPYYTRLSLVLYVLLLGYAGLSAIQAKPLHVLWYQEFGALMAQVGVMALTALLVSIPFLLGGADWQNEDSPSSAYGQGILSFGAALAVILVSLHIATAFQGR